jgi:hypothetical protein
MLSANGADARKLVPSPETSSVPASTFSAPS